MRRCCEVDNRQSPFSIAVVREKVRFRVLLSAAAGQEQAGAAMHHIADARLHEARRTGSADSTHAPRNSTCGVRRLLGRRLGKDRAPHEVDMLAQGVGFAREARWRRYALGGTLDTLEVRQPALDREAACA